MYRPTMLVSILKEAEQVGTTYLQTWNQTRNILIVADVGLVTHQMQDINPCSLNQISHQLCARFPTVTKILQVKIQDTIFYKVCNF